VKGLEKDLLLHICCAPCLTYTRKELDRMGIAFTGFWYNPNVHPYREFGKRLEALEKYVSLKPMELLYDRSYDVKAWTGNALDAEGRGEDRCGRCYNERLLATALKARELGFKRFSTTLLFSKHQKHELIKSIAEDVARETGVDFFYDDFRPGWKRSIEICRELDIYRQGYCGCIYSEEERYLDPSPSD